MGHLATMTEHEHKECHLCEHARFEIGERFFVRETAR